MEQGESRCRYPSLDLSFELVKGVLLQQKQLAEAYNSQLVNLFTVATAVMGLGGSLGVLVLDRVTGFESCCIALIVTSVVAYVLVAITAAIGLWPRDYQLLDNPTTIRADFWTKSPSEFKEEYLSHVEDSYGHNERIMKWKLWPVYAMTVLLPFEAVTLVLALLSAGR